LSFFRDEKHLAQERDQWQAAVNTVMNLWVPLKAGNFLTSFSRRTLLKEVNQLLYINDPS
jgi:hypothetical protein